MARPLLSAPLLSALVPAVVAVSGLIGLSACGGDAPGGQARTAEAEAKPRVDPALLIQGTVTAPEGQTLDGAKVIACLTPQETCTQEATAPLTIQNGVGRFVLTVPVKGDYHLMVWKDADGDGALNAGDLMAFAHNMKAVPSGQRLTPMVGFVRDEGRSTANLGGEPMGTEAELAEAAAAVRSAGLAGRWSQSSTGTELVWGPEIKIQPSISTSGFGTNLGGTFGAGSPTNTTISYSYKPVSMSRTMTLEIAADGAFHWSARQERQTGKCRSVRQEKFGRIRVQDGQLTFVVADARQGCGGPPDSTIEVKDETYALSGGGGAFRLTGDHGVNWNFTRG